MLAMNTAVAIAFGMPGPWEIGLVLLIALILFGGKKLPELARGLGRGLREFKDELHGVRGEVDDVRREMDADQASTDDDAPPRPSDEQPAGSQQGP